MSYSSIPDGSNRNVTFGLFIFLLCALSNELIGQDQTDSVPATKHQVTGLFCLDRVRDLEKTMEKLPGVILVSVDFDKAEAEFRYDSAALFPNQPAEKVVQELDNRFRNASRHTFGIKPLCQKPRDQLQLVKIEVLGLDCKACCLAAYESVYKLEGVEQATASFKDGLVTAWIDPAKTNQEKLEDALVKRNVTLKSLSEK